MAKDKKAKKALKVERNYDAIAANNYRPRRGANASADVVMDNAKGRLREYARWLDENHDLAVGILDDIVTNTVGTGVGVEPIARAVDGRPLDDLNKQTRDLWLDFWEFPEVTGEIPGTELERLVVRSTVRDGELFIQHVTKASASYASAVPYSLEPLESDFVPFDLFSKPDGVTHGIRKNAWGQPLAYYVYKNHPGSLVYSTATATLDMKVVPAENMMHLKIQRRLHQTRGASLLHAVLSRLDDLKDYEESERIAARIGAAIAMAVTKGGEYDANAGAGEERYLDMTPGMIIDNLLPGEDVKLLDPSRPNQNLETFRKSMLRAIAAGTGTRFSSIAKDYNGTYSAQRQELVEGRVHYLRLHDYFVRKFYRPVWRRFIDAARFAGLLLIPQNADMASVYRPEFRAPALPWIDPNKEMEAHAKAVEQGFKSRAMVIRDLGGDVREVDAQLEADEFDVRPQTEEAPEDSPEDTQEDSAEGESEDTGEEARAA